MTIPVNTISCKYYDCGWCYAPDDVKTNTIQSGCFEPEHCPYLKSQMKETDISKVLIEGDTATIMGVKYKRVEEPKPETLYDVIYKWKYDTSYSTCDVLVDMIEEWLPDEIALDGLPGDAEYSSGWNDCLKVIGNKLR
jgi:hypothetical protein